MRLEPITPADEAVISEQLGRPARAVAGVAWRCPCGRPGVIATAPRLPDGTPFPTTYYLTCPKAVAACSRLESAGVMAELAERLDEDPEFAAAYQRAHESYLADRDSLGEVPELSGFSAGGMPTRVKCLHALLGHALAAGSGVNPVGDEVRERVGVFWEPGCGEKR
ncbi:MAG: DUF501 domain-containing protein [Propionibacteriaceae bacterium]|nr:DUF501 domain-containing protein [Propionibacteriaceae bacterium]